MSRRWPDAPAPRGHEVLLQVPMEPFDYPGQRSRPADAAHLAHAGAEHRPAVLADEPVPRLCRHRRRDGRALHRLRAVVRAGPARNRQARTDLCRRRRQSAERRRPDRRRQQPAVRQGRRDHRCGADAEPKSTARWAAWKWRRASAALPSAYRSALPVSIEHIAKWAKAAASRGLQLVPITAVALKAKQS